MIRSPRILAGAALPFVLDASCPISVAVYAVNR